MAEIPLAWRAYAEHQEKLGNRTSVDATAWGMEEGLNFLIESDHLSADALTVERVMSNSARRSRNRQALLARHVLAGSNICDPVGRLEARSDFAVLRREMPKEKLLLLVDLAAGIEPVQLASRQRIAPRALRARTMRARTIARAIAA